MQQRRRERIDAMNLFIDSHDSWTNKDLQAITGLSKGTNFSCWRKSNLTEERCKKFVPWGAKSVPAVDDTKRYVPAHERVMTFLNDRANWYRYTRKDLAKMFGCSESVIYSKLPIQFRKLMKPEKKVDVNLTDNHIAFQCEFGFNMTEALGNSNAVYTRQEKLIIMSTFIDWLYRTGSLTKPYTKGEQ